MIMRAGECKDWWTWSGSNRRPLPCHGSALPAAPQALVRGHYGCVADYSFILADWAELVNAATKTRENGGTHDLFVKDTCVSSTSSAVSLHRLFLHVFHSRFLP